MCVLDNKIEDELQTMRRCELTSNASGIAYGRGATQALLNIYLEMAFLNRAPKPKTWRSKLILMKFLLTTAKHGPVSKYAPP